MAGAKILVVDDDENICELLKLYLSKEGHHLVFAHDGSSALNAYRQEQPDIMILDLMLPLINGWEVCKMIRMESELPIIMLTAKDAPEEKIKGLDIGADDYVTKPFDPNEVCARVRVQLRKRKTGLSVSGDSPTFPSAPSTLSGSSSATPANSRVIPSGNAFSSLSANTQGGSVPSATPSSTLQAGNLTLDIKSYEASCGGAKIALTPKEIQLLHYLMRNRNIVLTREQILEQVWGYEYAGETRTVDMHVKKLREKLAVNQGWEIKTIYGVGYKFEVY